MLTQETAVLRLLGEEPPGNDQTSNTDEIDQKAKHPWMLFQKELGADFLARGGMGRRGGHQRTASLTPIAVAAGPKNP